MVSINELLKKSGVLLAIGYLLGQGTTLASQLTIKQFGTPELLGLAVLLISLFSFAFQFNDFGNTTFAIKTANERNWHKLFGFLIARSFIGVLISFALVFYVTQYQKADLDRNLLITIPLLALASGLMMTGAVEQSGNYKKLAFLQNFPWLINGIAVLTLLFFSSNQLLIQALWLFAILLSLYFSYDGLFKPRNAFARVRIAPSLGLVLAHTGPPLLGQVLGRFILFTVAHSGGLALVGAYGLVKYAQVGTSLLLSFWVRPIHRSLSINETSNTWPYLELLKQYSQPLLASIFIAIFGYFCFNLPFLQLDPDIRRWGSVLFILPFWIIGSISSQAIARLGNAKLYTTIEVLGLMLNATTFLSLVHADPVLGVIFGEILQHIFIGLSFFLIHMSKRRVNR